MFIFPTYTSYESIYDALGFEWDQVYKTGISYRDDITLLVFTKGDKVVRYIEYPKAYGDFSSLEKDVYEEGQFELYKNNSNNYSYQSRGASFGKMLMDPKYSMNVQNSTNSNMYRRNNNETSKIDNNTSIQNMQNNASNTEINKLPHKLIESTTEDPEHPLRELTRGMKGGGWFSSRFSQFPQEIYVQFPQPVLIKQVNIVVHEKSIPSQIKFK